MKRYANFAIYAENHSRRLLAITEFNEKRAGKCGANPAQRNNKPHSSLLYAAKQAAEGLLRALNTGSL